MIEIIKIAISLFPVFVFLAALIFLDSYKLVTPRSVILTIIAGGVAAGVCLWMNGWLLSLTRIDNSMYSRYAAPVVEESAKALFLIIFFRKNRIGFMVDAAIYGFAIGAGFSLVENIYYLLNLESTNILLWVIRGFGTAAVHASTMAIFGIISKHLTDRRASDKWLVFFPGLAAAFVIHSLFNHFVFSPLITTLILLVALPLLVLFVFERSERATQDWLGVGFDADQELLHILTTGRISESNIGKYLKSLQNKFSGTVVADMFCLLRVHTELALRAKGTLLLQEAGIKAARDPEIQAKLEELKYLEKSIGQTGKLAILPFLRTSSRDLWQIYRIK